MNRILATVIVLLPSPLGVLHAAVCVQEDQVHPAAAPANSGDASAGPAYGQADQVIVVCKTHFDLGYTHRVKDLLDYYRTTMIDRALGIMDASKDLPPAQQFVWTSPGWVMEKVLEDIAFEAPDLQEKVQLVDAAYVSRKLQEIASNQDLSRYIL